MAELKTKILTGTCKRGGGTAKGNIKAAQDAGLFDKKKMNLDGFHPGTININLDEEFKDDDCYALCIYQYELIQANLCEVTKQNKCDEVWRFIRVTAVNGHERKGYVYRTNHPKGGNDWNIRYGVHGPKTIELMTEKLDIKEDDRIKVQIIQSMD